MQPLFERDEPGAGSDVADMDSPTDFVDVAVQDDVVGLQLASGVDLAEAFDGVFALGQFSGPRIRVVSQRWHPGRSDDDQLIGPSGEPVEVVGQVERLGMVLVVDVGFDGDEPVDRRRHLLEPALQHVQFVVEREHVDDGGAAHDQMSFRTVWCCSISGALRRNAISSISENSTAFM